MEARERGVALLEEFEEALRVRVGVSSAEWNRFGSLSLLLPHWGHTLIM